MEKAIFICSKTHSTLSSRRLVKFAIIKKEKKKKKQGLGFVGCCCSWFFSDLFCFANYLTKSITAYHSSDTGLVEALYVDSLSRKYLRKEVLLESRPFKMSSSLEVNDKTSKDSDSLNNKKIKRHVKEYRAIARTFFPLYLVFMISEGMFLKYCTSFIT